MEISIQGKAERNFDKIKNWLKFKGVQGKFLDVPEGHAKAGAEYNIRADYMTFQSCLETGFFSFRGDVKPEQNNFAGIGAKGGGAAGDSFSSVFDGCKAQAQNLALRSGSNIDINTLLSPYTKANYETIKGRNSFYWSDLAGTYAADKEYWHKIEKIRDEFDAWSAQNIDKTQEITWLELNRTDDRKPAITAYMGEIPKYTHYYTSKKDLCDWMNQFTNANSVLVADTRKSIPKCPDFGENNDDIPVTKGLNWCPFALTAKDGDCEKINGSWDYPLGYPESAVIHFTAGGNSCSGTISWLAQCNYPCIVIGREGEIYQPFPLSRGGNHSGTWHHTTYIGIEIVAAGRVERVIVNGEERFKAYFHNNASQYFYRKDVRYSNGKDGYLIEGWYHAYTIEQERALRKLLLWLKENDKKNVFNINEIIGHDQACADTGAFGRKNDPGAALSQPLDKWLDKYVANKQEL
ncbi:N-acetylmuramoyl-L-alanine amidase [Caudoviricetes sp.]|nr:N-acetylmuramoyl-L-alanine amidase [Caudoviricetes sp.]